MRLGKFIENSHEKTLQAKSSNYGDMYANINNSDSKNKQN
jgi:hypothetical protein